MHSGFFDHVKSLGYFCFRTFLCAPLWTAPLVFSLFTQSRVARRQPLLHLHDDLIHTIAEEALFQLS